MVQLHHALQSAERPTLIEAQVLYNGKPTNGEQLFCYLDELPDGQTDRSNVSLESHTVQINDLRDALPVTVRSNGLQLDRIASTEQEIQWDDEQQVKAKYYPQIESLLQKVTGASRVFLFDHTFRTGKLTEDKDGGTAGVAGQKRRPLQRVHADYTHTSGPRRLGELLPTEAESLQQKPYAVLQTWQPLKPVQDSPLALCDATTVAKADLMTIKLRFTKRDAEGGAVAYNPAHRWYYAKNMQPNEVYVFMGYDSHEDGRPRFTPHTAFVHPDSPADAPERESIETRSYVFWDN